MGDKYTDIYVSGTVEHVQQMTQQVFIQNGFQVNWAGPTVGRATRGSQGMNFMLGAFAQYYEIDFQIHPQQNNNIAVRLIKGNSGWMGGAIGAHNVKKQYNQVLEMLTSYFHQMNMYNGTDEKAQTQSAISYEQTVHAQPAAPHPTHQQPAAAHPRQQQVQSYQQPPAAPGQKQCPSCRSPIEDSWNICRNCYKKLS